MKKIFALAWLLLPVPFLAWHYGPGQAQLARDRAAEQIRATRAAAARCDWDRAAALYAEAADSLPEEDTTRRRRLRLAEAQCRIRAGGMIEGQEQLEELLVDVERDGDSDPALTAAARHELATASYHAAWLMRLEGAAADEWKPESERARQQFRLLAEQADEAGEQRVEGFRKNLEATIRLENMDLSVLKAKPLPKNCPSCKNLSQRKRKQCQSRCKSEGKGKGKKEDGKQDARQAIKQSRSAGLNEREGTGS